VITIRVELDDENKGRIPVVVFHRRQLNEKGKEYRSQEITYVYL